MATTVSVRFAIRRGTAAEWTAANPVLLDGEPGYETDTRKVKWGDGATAWNALLYEYDATAPGGSGVSDGDYGDIVVSGSGAAFAFDPGVVSTFARTFLDDANAPAVRATLGLASVAASGDAADLSGTLSNLRLAAFTGDVTKPAASGALTLATVNANTGTFGGAATVPQFSVDGKGRITGVAAVPIAITKAAAGLANVDNTSDANKPVSTAQQTALDLKANLAGPAFTGAPSAPTAAAATNSTQLATTAFVQTLVANVIGSAPAALDTLTELAAALGNDANYAATITAALAGKQPVDPTLTAFAGLTGGADKLAYFTGTDVLAQATLTAFARTLLDDADQAAMRATLGVVPGTDVQAYDADLAAIAVLATTAYGRSVLTQADGTALRTLAGLGTVATFNTGTSGATIPLLNGTNAWAGVQTYSLGIKITGTGGSVTNTDWILESAADPLNATYSALFLRPNTTGAGRLFLGSAAKPFFAVNFANVTTLESVPVITTTDGFNHGYTAPPTVSHQIGRVGTVTFIQASGPGAQVVIGGGASYGDGVTRFTVDTTTGNATATGTLTASNLSGTNTGDQDLSAYAPKASPAFTGNPTAPTPAAGDNDTSIATTAYAMAAAPNASYRVLLDCSGSHTAARVAGTYWLGQGDPAGISGTGTLYPPNLIYIDPADYPTVNGLATKLRVRAVLAANDVAPTGTFTFGLYPVTTPATSGAAGLRVWTLGTVVPGSTVAIATPAADSANNAVGADFAVPAAGLYVLGFVASGAVAASSHLHISAALQQRNA